MIKGIEIIIPPPPTSLTLYPSPFLYAFQKSCRTNPWKNVHKIPHERNLYKNLYGRGNLAKAFSSFLRRYNRDMFISHLMRLVWGEAFDWSVESTIVTAVSSQLVEALRGFSIVELRGTIERLDRRVSNVPKNESRLYFKTKYIKVFESQLSTRRLCIPGVRNSISFFKP